MNSLSERPADASEPAAQAEQIAKRSLFQALEDEYRAHGHRIERYFRRRVHNDHAAEDLTQEVFAEAADWLARSGCQPRSISAFVQTLAARRASDFWRVHIDEVSLSEAEHLESPVDRRPALSYAVTHALAALPPLEKRVVAMRLLQGCTFEEISAATHIREGACRMRFLRGEKALRLLMVAAMTAQGFDGFM